MPGAPCRVLGNVGSSSTASAIWVSVEAALADGGVAAVGAGAGDGVDGGEEPKEVVGGSFGEEPAAAVAVVFQPDPAVRDGRLMPFLRGPGGHRQRGSAGDPAELRNGLLSGGGQHGCLHSGDRLVGQAEGGVFDGADPAQVEITGAEGGCRPRQLLKAEGGVEQQVGAAPGELQQAADVGGGELADAVPRSAFTRPRSARCPEPAGGGRTRRPARAALR